MEEQADLDKKIYFAYLIDLNDSITGPLPVNVKRFGNTVAIGAEGKKLTWICYDKSVGDYHGIHIEADYFTMTLICSELMWSVD